MCPTADAQIYRVAQMNAGQIRALDKQKTVVILTGGILEQHGPHPPSYTDTYVHEWLTERLVEAVVGRPGWPAFVFPTIPLGSGGASELGGHYVFPGSYTISRSTLRAVYMDLATELGEQGFRWVFVNHEHGAPLNNLMLDQAGNYFRDTYGGRMVHLRGLELTEEQLRRAGFTEPMSQPSDAAARENRRLDIDAAFDETSVMLFLRPDLVSHHYRRWSLKARCLENLVALQRRYNRGRDGAGISLVCPSHVSFTGSDSRPARTLSTRVTALSASGCCAGPASGLTALPLLPSAVNPRLLSAYMSRRSFAGRRAARDAVRRVR